MKKVLCLMLGVILTFGLVGCGEKAVEENSTESIQEYTNNVKNQKEERAQIEQKQYDSNKKSISEELTVTETKLKLKEYGIVDSILLEGKRSIVITFDYTNNREANDMFGAIVGKATESRLILYQDGIELRPDGVLAMKKNYDSLIKQGATIETIYGFTLENETSDIEVELMNYSGEKSTCIIKLK